MLIAEEILIEIIQGTRSVIIPDDGDDDESVGVGDGVDDGDIGGEMMTILSASSSSAAHISTLTASQTTVASSSIVKWRFTYSCNMYSVVGGDCARPSKVLVTKLSIKQSSCQSTLLTSCH